MKKAVKKEAPSYTIQNCTISANGTAANQHTEAAAVALANASGKHAEALIEIARLLQGSAKIETGIHIGDKPE